MTKVRDILRLKYPDREFDPELLNRLLKKGYDEHFGSDSDCMAKFMNRAILFVSKEVFSNFKLLKTRGYLTYSS